LTSSSGCSRAESHQAYERLTSILKRKAKLLDSDEARKGTTIEKEHFDMQKITTFLTFNDRAEEAVEFYTSVFKHSRIVSTTRYGDQGPGPAGSLMSATFLLDGQQFMALNGGPSFSFAQGISLFVSCDTQKEIDELWEKLSERGEKGPCGWLTDRFGVSWQVVPAALAAMLSDKNQKKADSVMAAMLQMTKLDISRLQDAYSRA
jgi:predicted 3-demethylubiquinone-9 3-methyltransferase (glyoxalase superfamily)